MPEALTFKDVVDYLSDEKTPDATILKYTDGILGVLLAAGAAYSAYSSVYWTLLFRSLRALPEPAARGAIAPA